MDANGFTCAPTRSLRRAGLTGKFVAVTASEGGLQLASASGGVIFVAASTITQLRLERVEGKGAPVFSAYIHRAEKQPVFRLLPLAGERRGYAIAMRALAQRLVQLGGPERVVCGESKAAAILMIGVAGMVMAGAIAFALLYDGGLPGWEAVSFLAAAATLLIFFCWVAATRLWPRPPDGSAMLDRHLPDWR